MSDFNVSSIYDMQIRELVRNALKPGSHGKTKITKREIVTIIDTAVGKKNDGTVNESEANALITILAATELSVAAKRHLTRFINDRRKQNANKQNVEDGKARIVETLKNQSIVRAINFTSPQTHAKYHSVDYQKVGALIEADEIETKLFDYGVGGEREFMQRRVDGGTYDHSANELFVLRSSNTLDFNERIVHEATHVIQDFRDLRIKHKYAEADAYIAQALVRLTAEQHTGSAKQEVVLDEAGKGKRNAPGKILAAALPIAKALLKPKGKIAEDAYTDLVEVVEKDETYARFANKNLFRDRAKKRDRESKLWEEVKSL